MYYGRKRIRHKIGIFQFNGDPADNCAVGHGLFRGRREYSGAGRGRVDFVVARVLDHLNIEQTLIARWGEDLT